MKLVHIHFEELLSTSDWAKEHSAEFDPQALTYITTEHQTNGHGRQGRSWISLPGNLSVTLCFIIEKGISNVGQLLALCIAEMLTAYGIFLKLKWPNDLLAQDRKLGGILTERIALKGKQGVALGLGLNLFSSPQGLDQATISLAELMHSPLNAETFLKILLPRFLLALQQLKEEGFAPFQQAMNTRLAYRGDKVAVTLGKRTYTGILHSISESGTLFLILENGEHMMLSSGEITHLRRP